MLLLIYTGKLLNNMIDFNFFLAFGIIICNTAMYEQVKYFEK